MERPFLTHRVSPMINRELMERSGVVAWLGRIVADPRRHGSGAHDLGTLLRTQLP